MRSGARALRGGNCPPGAELRKYLGAAEGGFVKFSDEQMFRFGESFAIIGDRIKEEKDLYWAKGVAIVPSRHRPELVRRDLQASLLRLVLFKVVRSGFEKIPGHPREHSPISVADALMSAFAMFALKDPSWLAFDPLRNDQNMKVAWG